MGEEWGRERNGEGRRGKKGVSGVPPEREIPGYAYAWLAVFIQHPLDICKLKSWDITTAASNDRKSTTPV